MTIAIIGCGAMGSLFGALLARGGHAVWMVDNHPERAQVIAAHGIRVEAPGGALHLAVSATTNPGAVPAPDFAFIFVKACDTAAAAEAAAALAGPQTSFVTLQNGLGNIETLVQRFGAERVIGGTTAHGATELAPAYVRHAGVGVTVIGVASAKPSDSVAALANLLRSVGLEVEVTEDLASAMWSKLVVNCGINALGALTRLPNGALIEDAGTAAVLRAAVEEAAAVAAMKGIALAYRDPVEHTRQVCRATAQNVNSMLQDVLRQRRTEVEAINGAIAREGDEVGAATPVNDVLANLVGAIERGYRKQVGRAPGAS
jgi:2-dehydropantoate 2-reductase